MFTMSTILFWYDSMIIYKHKVGLWPMEMFCRCWVINQRAKPKWKSRPDSDEKLRDHQNYYGSSSGEHECLHRISWSSIQNVSKCFIQNDKSQLVGLKMNSKVILIHSQGTMNVSRKCCANPSNCWNMSQNKYKLSLVPGIMRKVRESTSSCWDISVWIKVGDRNGHVLS